MQKDADFQEMLRDSVKNASKITKGIADAVFKRDAIGKVKGVNAIVENFGKQLDVIDRATKKFGTPKACSPVPHFTDNVKMPQPSAGPPTPFISTMQNQ
jgi:hypothetical protein